MGSNTTDAALEVDRGYWRRDAIMTALPEPSIVDLFLHRELTMRVASRRLGLAVSQELFSSHAIDTGSLLLLKFLDQSARSNPETVLDLGCGYGPLALAAGVRWPDSNVLAVDRDALATLYTDHNARANDLPVTTAGSLGYDAVRDSLSDGADLIISNVPAKGGPRLHERLLLDGAHHLRPSGTAIVVIVNPLAPMIESWAHDGRIEIIESRRGAGHTVFEYVPAAPSDDVASDSVGDAYNRTWMTVTHGAVRYRVHTVYGLTEFDQLGYHTELAFRMLPTELNSARVTIWNPGQGHLIGAVANAGAASVALVDRDLLALRASQRLAGELGLAATGAHVAHPSLAELGAEAQCSIVVVRAKEPLAAQVLGIEHVLDATGGGGWLLVTGPATAVHRAVHGVSAKRALRIEEKKSQRGFGCVRVRVA